MDLKSYFHQKYQGGESFIENVILPIFGENKYEDAYEEDVIENNPDLETMAKSTGISNILRLGTIQIPMNPTDVFDITVDNHVQMERNRVTIQALIRRIMSTYSSAFMIFHYNDTDKWDWRFSFCSKLGNNKETTDSKRYTFLLGPNQSCRTAAENFNKLAAKAGNIELEDIVSAFDVETLSKEFFDKYKKHYETFCDFVYENKDNREYFGEEFSQWEDKTIRDYVKKLLGRIVFLHFLQKKGWLGVPADKEWGDGETDFMRKLFDNASQQQKDNYLDEVLEPLFEYGLDTDRTDKNDLFNTGVEGFRNVKVPYLNGGLFDRDVLDEPKSRFPKELFDNLLRFFSEYNFTIDENDPNDAQVGVDPEMLGRIFENLLEDNKDKGAFYTPKEIVQYMCRESLIAYLQTDVKDEESQEAIRKFVTTYDVNAIGGKDSDTAKEINEHLKQVKICDPAIGSGAFPMGLLKELFFCRGAIETFDDAAEIKRHIIQQNIYGVDIEKGAVDIARLRFWLALIVDEKTPHALPNMDFKIMQGNSLLEEYKGVDLSRIMENKNNSNDHVQMTLFENDIDVLRHQLIALRKEYFNTYDKKQKESLRVTMRGIVQQQIDTVINNYGGSFNNKQSNKIYIKDIDIASTSEFFLWHTWFNDVFERRGFNIVIGNPPYVSAPTQIASPKLNEQRKRIVASKKYKSLYEKWDLYVPFMELGLQLLCPNGIFSMIVPYPLTNQKYGKILRKMIAEEYHLLEITDLNGTKIFENATVSNCIPFIQNNCPEGQLRITNIFEDKTIREVLRKVPEKLKQDEKKYVWNLTEKERTGKRFPNMNVLGDFCYISKGMVVNAHENVEKGAFKKEDLISLHYDELHSRRYLEAKDIDKYQVRRVRYLEWNTERCPDKLSRPTFRELYDQPKLIMNCLGTINVTIDLEKHFLHNHSIYCAVLWKDLKGISNKSISSSIKKFCKNSRTDMETLSEQINLYYLAGILNSSMADLLLADQRGGDYHIYPEHIRNIPIAKASKEQQEEIASLVEQILNLKGENPQADTTSLEHEIDLLVYDLYGLTKEERLIVDPDYKE